MNEAVCVFLSGFLMAIYRPVKHWGLSGVHTQSTGDLKKTQYKHDCKQYTLSAFQTKIKAHTVSFILTEMQSKTSTCEQYCD